MMTDHIPFCALNLIAQTACADALEHGLWKGVTSNHPGEERHACAVLVRDEAEEAMLAAEDRGHYAEELADVVIMALSSAGYLGIDIAEEVKRKMIINKGRPYLHGKEDTDENA